MANWTVDKLQQQPKSECITVKPSTKAELALNGMAELARRAPTKPLALAVLADRQSISLSYLEQVFSALRRAGLVVSVRGPGGGYLLAKASQDIKAGDIVAAVDGAFHPKITGSQPFGSDDGTDAFWRAMNSKVLDLFRTVTLKSIVDGDYAAPVDVSERRPQAAE
jgi:Rrf2 family iron-sulfur cluster assembly transcriptional regulator